MSSSHVQVGDLITGTVRGMAKLANDPRIASLPLRNIESDFNLWEWYQRNYKNSGYNFILLDPA